MFMLNAAGALWPVFDVEREAARHLLEVTFEERDSSANMKE